MKIRIELDNNMVEDEIVVRCKELNSEIKKIQDYLTGNKTSRFTFYKNEVEYYISLNDILFFETSEKNINAHTSDNVYEVKYRLYELENILPLDFIRISKSTILNINHVYSITKNLTSSSIVKFDKSYKQVYVSRNYYKGLKNRLEERRSL